MRRLAIALWDWVLRIPSLLQDAALYAGSGGFAFLTASYAVSSDYRYWGWTAGSVYFAVACACIICALVARGRHAALVSTSRRALLVVALLGAVIAPLCAELGWRAAGVSGAHAQPEVAVIERAADRVAAGHSPYLAHPTGVGNSPQTDNHRVDADTYFPYLPGMVLFGLLNATTMPAVLADARVLLVVFTLLVTGLALALSGTSAARRGRVAQFLVVLPWGALPLVTGGDDLPVLALLLLGLVLAARRWPVACGLALGAAATLKFTAWPILVLMAVVIRGRDGRPAYLRYGAATLSVLVPLVLVGCIPSPQAFVENVIRFPLGLTSVRSPAASPLIGQALTTLLPGERRPITAVLVLIGLAVVVVLAVKRTPRTPADVASFTAIALLLATLLAPATRFGYLIYPANLGVFAYLLAAVEPSPSRLLQSSSSTSKIRSSTLLDAVGVAPARAGVIEGLAGSTTTPTSQ